MHRTGSIELTSSGRVSTSPRARASGRVNIRRGGTRKQRRSPSALRQRLGALNRVRGRRIGRSPVSLRGGGRAPSNLQRGSGLGVSFEQRARMLRLDQRLRLHNP